MAICRDDGLISIPNSKGPLTCKIQKKFIRTFKYKELTIGISYNLKIVHFFYVTLNLNYNSYKPLCKINDNQHTWMLVSNNPASIVKQIPNAINIRINRLSLLKTSNNHKGFYNEAIYNSSYKNEPKYLESNRNDSNRGNNIRNNKTARGVMVILVGNGHGDTSSKPGRDWLHFT